MTADRAMKIAKSLWSTAMVCGDERGADALLYFLELVGEERTGEDG